MRVLQAIGEDSQPRSLTEICAATSFSSSSVQRILKSLESTGAVGRDPRSGRYHIGWMLRGLHLGHEWHDTLKAVASPHMLSLRSHCRGLTVGLYVLVTAREFACIESFPGTSGLQYIEPLYRPIPIGVGATSLVFLVQLADRYGMERLESWLANRFDDASRPLDIRDVQEAVRKAARVGAAYSEGYRINGMASISAPIADPRQNVVAALTVSGTKAAFDSAPLDGWTQQLRATAHRIEERYRGSTTASARP